jgi:hypothetical protein
MSLPRCLVILRVSGRRLGMYGRRGILLPNARLGIDSPAVRFRLRASEPDWATEMEV